MLEKIQHCATKLVSVSHQVLTLIIEISWSLFIVLSETKRRLIIIEVDSVLSLPILNNARTRGHTKRIFVNYSRSNLRKHFFINRVVQMWNNLPEEVVRTPSLNVFKAHLDSHWIKIKYGHIQRSIA